MYLSASEVAVSTLGALYKCSTFTFYLRGEGTGEEVEGFCPPKNFGVAPLCIRSWEFRVDMCTNGSGDISLTDRHTDKQTDSQSVTDTTANNTPWLRYAGRVITICSIYFTVRNDVFLLTLKIILRHEIEYMVLLYHKASLQQCKSSKVNHSNHRKEQTTGRICTLPPLETALLPLWLSCFVHWCHRSTICVTCGLTIRTRYKKR